MISTFGVESFPKHAFKEVMFPGLASFDSNFFHTCDSLNITLDKSRIMVVNPILLAKSFDQSLAIPQVVARQPREQVVLNLKLQTTVEPVHPLGAVHVHCGLHLLVEPLVVFHSMGVRMTEECVHREVT